MGDLQYEVIVTLGLVNDRSALPVVVGDGWTYNRIPPQPVASFKGNARQTAMLLRSLADEIYPTDQGEADGSPIAYLAGGETYPPEDVTIVRPAGD